MALGPAIARAAERAEAPKKIAAIVSVYTPDSHADVLVSRCLQSCTLDGKGRMPRLKIASLYTHQVPKNDISRRLAAAHGVPIYDTVAEALTLGTGQLAVDGVMLICEFGDYPLSPTGQIQYPKRPLFDQIVKVMSASGRVVPIFVDKHLADTWEDAKEIYDTAQRMRIPLMAGSSLPVLWRYPPLDIKRDSQLDEIVAVSFHTLDAYGFHALEMVQCLAERRAGGETGIRAVQCLVDEAVWKAGEQGVYDPKLLEAALQRVKWRPYNNPDLRKNVEHPVLWVIDYEDALRVRVLTLNYAVGQWASAWRYRGQSEVHSTLFWTQETRPYMHFTYLLEGIEQMMLTGQPSWPAERTLLTSGVLDALLISKRDASKRLETPQLRFSYKYATDWRQPPTAPGKRLFFPDAAGE